MKKFKVFWNAEIFGVSIVEANSFDELVKKVTPDNVELHDIKEIQDLHIKDYEAIK